MVQGKKWLTVEEIQFLLELIQHHTGIGYSDVPEVAQLQAKLSIDLEMSQVAEHHSKPIRPLFTEGR